MKKPQESIINPWIKTCAEKNKRRQGNEENHFEKKRKYVNLSSDIISKILTSSNRSMQYYRQTNNSESENIWEANQY